MTFSHLLARDGERRVADVCEHGGREQRLAAEPIEHALIARCQHENTDQQQGSSSHLGCLEDEVTQELPELRVLVVHATNVNQIKNCSVHGLYWDDSTVVESPSSAALKKASHTRRRTWEFTHHASRITWMTPTARSSLRPQRNHRRPPLPVLKEIAWGSRLRNNHSA